MIQGWKKGGKDGEKGEFLLQTLRTLSIFFTNRKMHILNLYEKHFILTYYQRW